MSQPYVVVAALDDSLLAERVVAMAAAHARDHAGKDGVELHLVHALEDVYGHPIVPFGDAGASHELAERLSSGRAYMDLAIAAATEVFTQGKILSHLVFGTPWREVLRVGREHHADLIVLGTHGRTGVKRFVFGSVAEQVVRRAGCPVLVVRDKDYESHAAAGEPVPAIEPPCPDCVATRRASDGKQQWCARHSEHHVKAHLHYEYPKSFGRGSQLIRP